MVTRQSSWPEDVGSKSHLPEGPYIIQTYALLFLLNIPIYSYRTEVQGNINEERSSILVRLNYSF